MRNQLFYKVFSASLIVILALAALPVKQAYAADTGLLSPTANINGTPAANAWTNPNNAFTSNNTDATAANGGRFVDYTNFGITIPAGNVINGIEVIAEGSTTGRDIEITLSWDNGANYTAAVTLDFGAAPDQVLTAGGATDTWGRTWNPTTNFTNANFRVRVTATGGGNQFDLDHIQVRVHYDLPPEINIQGNGTSIADGDTTPVTTDWTDFGNVSQGVPADRTFTIQNTGTGPLSLGAITFTGGDAGDFSVVSTPASTVAPGGSTTFTVRLTATGGGGGTRDTTVNIVNNDSNENPYNFTIQGTRVTTTTEINVQGNGTSITDGDTTPNVVDCTNFGTVGVGSFVDCIYTIQNLGANALFVGPITLGGANAADFSVTVSPASSVVAGGSTTFTVRFSPSASGARNATISFANNDTGENPYNWNIQGTGSALATPTLSITNSPVTYNGSPQAAIVTCSSGGAVSNILYNGSATVPTNAGTYAVTANCAAVAGFSALTNASAGNFVINPATPTASITNNPQTYNGSPQTAAVACSSGGTATLASGGAGTNAGSYPATVNCAASANYSAATGLSAGNFVINPATPTASITNNPQTYNGSSQIAAVACSGGGAATLASGGAGTNAGSYLATVNCAASTNYSAATGLSAGNFVINPATPTASITNNPQTYNGLAQTATVACLGGGTATLASGGIGTNAGSYPATVNCAASTNYSAATGLSAGNFVINPATQTLTVTNGPVDYDGSPHAATVACSGGGIPSNILTGGAASQTNAGIYSVTADCAATTNYSSATGLTAGNSFVINQINPTASVTNSPQNYTGTPQSATVACLGGGAASNILTGGAASQTDASTYAVIADCAASTNYAAETGISAGNFVINPITPTATVTNTPQNYTGAPQSATVACSGGGAASNIVTGGAATQTDVGIYAVTVDCAASTNYIAANGVSAGNFVINIISQTISVTTSAPTSSANGTFFDVAATASSGLPVTITVSGVCSIADLVDGSTTDGDATVTMTSGTGTCSVFYDQAGNTNYTAAPQVQEDVDATDSPVITSANTISFDFGFISTFNITATGNPSTMTITMTGEPAGITITDNGDGTATLDADGTTPVGTYTLIFTADNGVAPNGTQTFTLTIRNGPVVAIVNSTPDTGNGNLNENENISTTLGVNQITVEFSSDVYDPAGDTDADDVTNPANYILVRSANGTFGTTSCLTGVGSPDVQISVDTVTYSNAGGSGPFVGTLEINSGLPVNVAGFYRLFVCGTTSIVDATNPLLSLAGNGVAPGTDFTRNFRITAPVIGGGGGGGGGASSATTTPTLTGLFIPVTGFAPSQVTNLPAQPVDKEYSKSELTIKIPSLGMNLPIVGIKLDKNGWDVTWLGNNAGYLEGSAYPTWNGNSILTSHVTDPNGKPGPFAYINELRDGEKIYVHNNGFIYVYEVRASQLISPSSINSLFKHEEDAWITLVTCENYNEKTGTFTHRRVVRAVLISVIAEK